MSRNPQNQLKLSQLRILAAVAEHNSFSEAALDLEMSQSAVSHAIAALEDHLGIVLFVRGRQGARLTPVATQIVEHSRAIVGRIEAIHRVAETAKGLQGGQVRIASFRSAAAHLLPSTIVAFHQRFPDITVNIAEYNASADVEQALREGDADIGFTLLPAGQHLETWEVMRDEFIALCPAALKPHSSPLTWQELIDYPLILHPANYRMMQQVYDHVRSQGYTLKAAYEVETDATIVNLVAQGLGATILPRLAAEPIPPHVRAYSLPVPFARVIGVAVLAEGLHLPAVYAFLETIKGKGIEP
ncbi:LysR family transcriptional regulator [Altericista sp. CCNU0014]|uniref:LysR family transcriptional regulator n=1 Tax=Altericista sp. CCNU0014 TaxID=3082949 RepID=UPI003850B15A